MPDVKKTKNVTDGQVRGLNYACMQCVLRAAKRKSFFGA